MPLQINLGCGNRDFGEGWVHVDGSMYAHIHSHNIIDLPFDENSVDIIYASHVLEYFDRNEANIVLCK